MPYDLATSVGLVATVGFIVQVLKSRTSIAEFIPLWAVVLLVSLVTVSFSKLFGILSGGYLPAVINVVFNALMASGAFSWLTGKAGVQTADNKHLLARRRKQTEAEGQAA